MAAETASPLEDFGKFREEKKNVSENSHQQSRMQQKKPMPEGKPSNKKELTHNKTKDTRRVCGTTVIYENRKISDERLKKLPGRKEIKKLELRACRFEPGNLIAKTIVDLLGNGLETLVLSGSEISGKHLEYIGEHMPENNKLKNLDLSHVTLDETGIKAVTKIKHKVQNLEWLNLHDCELDNELLKLLLDEETTVRSLKLSSNPDIWNDVKMVIELITKFGCEEIDISTSSLDSNHVTQLAENDVEKVTTVHVCENPIDDWGVLGNLVRNWKLENLDASECRMDLEDCEDFAFALDGCSKMQTLNVCHSDRTDEFNERIRTHHFLKDTAHRVMIDQND